MTIRTAGPPDREIRTADDFVRHVRRLDHLLAAGTSREETVRINSLQDWIKVHSDVLSAFAAAPSAGDLQRNFLTDGASSLLDVGEGRGQDFKGRQGHGAWAEKLLFGRFGRGSTDFVLVPFGPSDDIHPGHPAYQKHRRAYREIELLEGKRPDFLLFRAEDRDVASWLYRRRNHTVDEKARTVIETFALAAVETKSSLWLYKVRRRQNRKPLSYTVKAEEIEPINAWIEGFGKSLLIAQSFVDEVYLISYDDFLMRREASSRTYANTGKPTFFAPTASSERLADIDFEPGSIVSDPAGQVSRLCEWPQASLANVNASLLATLVAKDILLDQELGVAA